MEDVNMSVQTLEDPTAVDVMMVIIFRMIGSAVKVYNHACVTITIKRMIQLSSIII